MPDIQTPLECLIQIGQEEVIASLDMQEIKLPPKKVSFSLSILMQTTTTTNSNVYLLLNAIVFEGIISCLSFNPDYSGLFAAGSYTNRITLYNEKSSNSLVCSLQSPVGSGITQVYKNVSISTPYNIYPVLFWYKRSSKRLVNHLPFSSPFFPFPFLFIQRFNSLQMATICSAYPANQPKYFVGIFAIRWMYSTPWRGLQIPINISRLISIHLAVISLQGLRYHSSYLLSSIYHPSINLSRSAFYLHILISFADQLYHGTQDSRILIYNLKDQSLLHSLTEHKGIYFRTIIIVLRTYQQSTSTSQ